jgi:hypothetical protein
MTNCGGRFVRAWPLWLACLAAAAGPARAEVVFPHDPAVLDVRRDLGAVGDGMADDTAALQAGLLASCGTGGVSHILYLPAGIYRVTNTLVVGNNKGPWVYGAARDRVTIRLDDGIAGSNVTAVLRTHPNDGRATSADYFMRNFRHLTIDVGDNPGIDGIRWFGNNSSILQDVRVTGRGRIGIHGGFCGQSGPNLIQDALVEGFETGIQSAWIWGQTLSRVTIRNCRSNGVYVSANSVAIEDLAVENTPCALVNEYPNDWTWWGGVVALVGGRFSGPAGAGPAIRNRSVLYARDVVVSGHAAAIASATPGGDAAGPRVEEYLSHPPQRLFDDAPAGALRLPIQREPAVPWETNLARWVCANEHGVVTGDDQDDTAALQAAVDAAAARGATTVYLRGIGPKWYNLKGTVHLHGSVNRLIGLGFGRVVAGPEGRFLVDDRSAPVVKFQHLQAFGGRAATFENQSVSNVLVMESCDGLALASGGGDIFLTDCPAHVEIRSPRASVWARQLNPEGTSDRGLVRNHGGRLWALGVKHEGAGVRFRNDNGAQTEILGMFNYGPGVDADDPRPIIESDHAAFSLAGAREIVFGGHSFPVKVREARDGEVRQTEGGGWLGWSLFSGWTPAQRTGPTTAARPELWPAGDEFLTSITVTAATTTAGATLRYTDDGAEPTVESPAFPVALVLTSAATLRVRAFASGLAPSITRTAVFQRLILLPAEPAPADGATDFQRTFYTLSPQPRQLPDFAALPAVATARVAKITLDGRPRDADFAARFTGRFQAPTDGLYTFYTTSDDGSRLWIDDRLVVDNEGAHAAQTRRGRIALQAGWHPFVVAYWQGGGEYALGVEVEGPTMSRRALGR